MTNRSNTCDADRLKQLLADQLPEPLQAEVAEHVAECSECRQYLDSLAGDPSWWSEVECCFRANPQPEPLDERVAQSTELAGLDRSFAADFAVGFLEPSEQPNALGRLGEFEILEVIGRGGMGIVLKGFHRELGRYVAVKVMAPHLAASGTARQRFIREARAAAAIVHPNVMPIHAVCTVARLPYLVMPFIACESLQQRIDRQGPLELKEVLRIGIQVSAGLAAAHAQGLVHRDIKPANILLEKSVDRAMLTDFGLARAADDGSLTRSGVVTGTPQYMSPEQAQGEAVDGRSDLFSLGSVLYAMASGCVPFRAETALGVLRRISDHEPRPIRQLNADVPEWFEAIVLRLHEKSPPARFGSALEVADLLEQCLAHVQQPTATRLPEVLGDIAASSRIARSRRAIWWITGIGACVVVAAGAWRTTSLFTQRKAGESKSVERPFASPELSDQSVTESVERLDRELGEFEWQVRTIWDEPDLSDDPSTPIQLEHKQ